jgi:hypothetical protein
LLAAKAVEWSQVLFLRHSDLGKLRFGAGLTAIAVADRCTALEAGRRQDRSISASIHLGFGKRPDQAEKKKRRPKAAFPFAASSSISSGR